MENSSWSAVGTTRAAGCHKVSYVVWTSSLLAASLMIGRKRRVWHFQHAASPSPPRGEISTGYIDIILIHNLSPENQRTPLAQNLRGASLPCPQQMLARLNSGRWRHRTPPDNGQRCPTVRKEKEYGYSYLFFKPWFPRCHCLRNLRPQPMKRDPRLSTAHYQRVAMTTRMRRDEEAVGARIIRRGHSSCEKIKTGWWIAVVLIEMTTRRLRRTENED